MRYTRDQWNIINNNTKLAAQLGFDVSNNAFWINTRKKGGGIRYKKCNFSKYKPFFIQDPIWGKAHNPEYQPVTQLSALLRSHFGKSPVFDNFRPQKKSNLKKWKNVIAPIAHPNLHVYDFDNHDRSVALSEKIKEIYIRLSLYINLLIGCSEDFCGLHVFCLSAQRNIVERECDYFTNAGGHIDTFNCNKHNGIGIPGFDHYLYKEKDIQHFIQLLDVRFDKKISIYNNKIEQGIIYPEPDETPKEILEILKLYKDAKANVVLHLQGLKNCKKYCKQKQSENDMDYVQSLMMAEGSRTHILSSSNGHKYMIRALNNLNIQNIDVFKELFPDFEDNHYKLIEEMIEYIKDNGKDSYSNQKSKTNENDYAKQVKDIRTSLQQIFHSNHIQYNENLLSVATYLTNCIKHGVNNPGFIHYIEFCKMNNEKPVQERMYYRMVRKCRKTKLVSIPDNYAYTVGKKCRKILKGCLLIIKDFENIVKKTSKAYEYKKLNNIYNKVYAIPSFSIILCADKLFSEKFTNVYRLNNFDTLIL